MANRRMFSGAIVSSARFLQMGQTARLLYYDLGMNADDSGIVEAFTVTRMTGACEDDLKLLAAKGFIVILNADLVTYICDWDKNNAIRSDRRQPSLYEELLARYQSGELIPYLCAESELTTKCQPTDNQLTTNCQPTDNQVATNCQPTDNQVATNCPHRLGKERLGKVRSEEVRSDQDRPEQDRIGQESGKPPRTARGRYKNVYLSDGELTALQAEFPEDWQQRIERVSEYVASSGKTYRNYLAVIRAWARKDRSRAAPQPANPVYDLEGIFQ